MSTFSGEQGVGAMREHRRAKRIEALARNATAQATKRACGHVHGTAQKDRCAR